MKVLIADDDHVSRRVLDAYLTNWGYEVNQAVNGAEALRILQADQGACLAILDWMMPKLDGVEVCRRLRAVVPALPLYLIVLTVRGNSADVIRGLDAGADDYITKPFDREELRARLRVGERTLDLQARLSQRVQELEVALAKVWRLQGLVPICAYCKRIRNDQNYWEQVEKYVSDHSGAEFSHGICPECYEKHVAPECKGSGKREK